MNHRWVSFVAAFGLSLFILSGCKPAPDDALTSVHGQGERIVAPYGSWRSPLLSSQVFSYSDDIGELQSIGNAIYFSQANGNEGGKININRLESDGRVMQVVPAEFNVGSKVHEYGGAAFLAIGQSVFATKRADQLFYRFAPNQAPLSLTPNGTRHADCISYPKGSRIICVREDHRNEGDPKASLVTINLNFPGEGDILVKDHDFIAAPTISPDNTQLAWVTWEHPNMPWDKTALWLGNLDRKGQLHNVRQVAKDQSGSITQPLFSPDGQLYFVADFNNWWNIYRLSDSGTVELVHKQDADFAVPDWHLGNHNYAFETPSTIIGSYIHNGEASLLRINVNSNITEKIAVDFGEISQVVQGADGVYFVGAKETPEKGIYRVAGRGVSLMYAPSLPSLAPQYISRARNISFSTGKNETAWGYFYQPVNPDFVALNDTRPPLIIMLHGGPTTKASLAYRSDIQYWTSRGFAVLDLNFRGSSGFGRAYRQALYGNWGKADVEDAVNAARYLSGKGLVDGSKMAIQGGSAGGLTVFSALAFYDVFQAGVAYSGISDFETLSQETHKFESGYLDHLIGPLATSKEVYRERSPLRHLDGLNEPMLMMQGTRDAIVAPAQTQRIYDGLKARGVPVALVRFEGEGHGSWKPDSRARGLEAELSFYGQIFGFTPADKIPTLVIENTHSLAPRDINPAH